MGKQTRTVAIVTQALRAKPEFAPMVCVLTPGQGCPLKVASNTDDKVLNLEKETELYLLLERRLLQGIRKQHFKKLSILTF